MGTTPSDAYRSYKMIKSKVSVLSRKLLISITNIPRHGLLSSSGVKDVAHGKIIQCFVKGQINCGNRYKDNDTGRLSGVYAGSTVHYNEMISNVRWEDMDLDYINVNLPVFFFIQLSFTNWI